MYMRHGPPDHPAPRGHPRPSVSASAVESDAGCHLGAVAGHVPAAPIPILLTVSPARGRAAGKPGAPGSSRRGARGGPTSPRSAAARLPSVTWGGLGPMGTVGGEGALACAPLQPPACGTLGARPVLPSLVRLRASGTLRDFVQHGSRALESTRPFNRARGPPPGTKPTEGDVIVVPAPCSACLSPPRCVYGSWDLPDTWALSLSHGTRGPGRGPGGGCPERRSGCRDPSPRVRVRTVRRSWASLGASSLWDPTGFVPSSPGLREAPARSHSGPFENQPPEGPCGTPAPWIPVPWSPARLARAADTCYSRQASAFLQPTRARDAVRCRRSLTTRL